MPKLLIPALATGTAMTLVGTVGVVSALHKNDVELVVDGVSTAIAVREDTVAEVLELEDIELDEHDVVIPTPETEIVDGLEITVNYGRKLTLNVDGQERVVWTTARSVDEALRYLDLDVRDAKLSASRSAGIGRAGLMLDIETAKDVSVTAAGETTDLTIAGDVSDALAEAGIEPDSDDIVKPGLDETLTDGMEVIYTDVVVKESTRKVEIAYDKTTRKSDSMYEGTSKVTTEGVPGEKVETYEQTIHDGKLKHQELIKTTVTKEPVTQVTTVGTKAKPQPKPKQSSSSTSSSSSASSSSSSGKGLNLAREAMWVRIAECESNNRWNINTGNGYYGGLQFNLATWRSVNGTDFAAYPHQATRAEQITVANRLYARRGTQPWSCA